MMNEPARLARPQRRYMDSYINAVREYIAGRPQRQLASEILRARFGEYLRVKRQAETEPLAGMVPATHLWLTAAGEYIGDLDLRHHLNASLRLYGGHIGYKIRPSMRRRGYGSLLCKLGIEGKRASAASATSSSPVTMTTSVHTESSKRMAVSCLTAWTTGGTP